MRKSNKNDNIKYAIQNNKWNSKCTKQRNISADNKTRSKHGHCIGIMTKSQMNTHIYSFHEQYPS